MARRLAESQGEGLARLHRFTLAAGANWDGSWSDLLAAGRAELER
jgi:hypothetical protein